MILLTLGLLVTVPTLVSADEDKPITVEAEAAADLRGLYTAMTKYLKKNSSWPQMPEDLFDGGEEEYFQFWIDALKPYGATAEMWKHSKDSSKGTGSYIPTSFSAGQGIPYKWEQPWFVARGSFGGTSTFIILPDGSVRAPGTIQRP